MNAIVVPRKDVSASDADPDTIYYELTTIVTVSIFALWGKIGSSGEVFVFNSEELSFEAKATVLHLVL